MSKKSRVGDRYQSNQGSGKYPSKVPGKHRFTAIASYTLTDDEAKGGFFPGAQVILGPEKLITLAICCIDCEEPLFDIADYPRKCVAGDEWQEPPT